MRRKYLLFVEILGVFLALIWLAPFYLMIVNSFKTKKEIIVVLFGSGITSIGIFFFLKSNN